VFLQAAASQTLRGQLRQVLLQQLKQQQPQVQLLQHAHLQPMQSRPQE
jgi:hypothetical protein